MSNIQQAFIDRIAAYNSPYLSGLIDALSNSSPEVSVRINRAKGATMPGDVEAVKWWQQGGFYLPERRQFTFDPALHQGLYYVQDASSMALAAIVSHLCSLPALQDADRLNYLDACAAPGGKTTAAIDALPDNALVVANEYDFHRANILAENVAKWGYNRTVVSRGDTKQFRKLNDFFDIIAADVPCSGEGMMRKDAEAAAQWSEALILECADRQRTIVDNLWRALRPGGYFIYSTCTFNREENEDIVSYLVEEYGAETIAIPALAAHSDIAPAIVSNNICYRFIPGRTRGEGLFVSVLHKPGESEAKRTTNKPRKQREKASPLAPDAVKTAKSWLIDGDNYAIKLSRDGETVSAIASDIDDDVTRLASCLDVIEQGITIGRIKGKDLIPTQQLALSRALRCDAFALAEVDYPTALAYLRREAINVPDGAPKGFNLLTYRNHPLGFIKNIGNRVNNLYPQQWRILSTAVPAEPPVILD
jgi:16S rRNA C967 or C1407 C5-methylase (RsmB/RsmF family)/NOL1/NOP2/fmu family ribosome biogenesis protein